MMRLTVFKKDKKEPIHLTYNWHFSIQLSEAIKIVGANTMIMEITQREIE